MLSCISFHYYSIASDELAVISTSGCYCFLWNKHLLISTGQAIYGKAYQKLSAKIQKIKHVSTVDVLGIGQANFSLSHPLYNLYYFLLIFSFFVMLPNILKWLNTEMDFLHTWQFSIYFWKKTAENNYNFHNFFFKGYHQGI